MGLPHICSHLRKWGVVRGYVATTIGPTNISANCEVKMRAGPGYGDPLEAVGPEKERRVRHAAEAFLARHPELVGLDVSLEVAAVRRGRIERVPLG